MLAEQEEPFDKSPFSNWRTISKYEIQFSNSKQIE